LRSFIEILHSYTIPQTDIYCKECLNPAEIIDKQTEIPGKMLEICVLIIGLALKSVSPVTGINVVQRDRVIP
jgi:hypothetical protein